VDDTPQSIIPGSMSGVVAPAGTAQSITVCQKFSPNPRTYTLVPNEGMGAFMFTDMLSGDYVVLLVSAYR